MLIGKSSVYYTVYLTSSTEYLFFVSNRFSGDIIMIDTVMPSVATDLISLSFGIAIMTIFNVYIGTWIIAPTAVLVLMIYFLFIIYNRTNRSIRRLDAISECIFQ